MFVASARNVNRNPVTRAAAQAVARKERADRMMAWAQAQRLAREAAEERMLADARARRRQARLERIERFLMRVPRILARSPADVTMLRLIAARVCRFHGVSFSDLCGYGRHGHVVLARQCVCYWARQLTGLSGREIGRFLGNRHYSTIFHADRDYRENASRARAHAARREPGLPVKTWSAPDARGEA